MYREESLLWIINFCFTFYRIKQNNEYKLEIIANSKIEYVDNIFNFLVENEIFLHLRIRWYNLDCSIAEDFQQEQIVRYTPSEEHRKKCKCDLCHINARLEFIDLQGRVTNSKSSEKEEEHRKECKDDLCDMNARLEYIDRFGWVINSKLFKDQMSLFSVKRSAPYFNNVP